MNEMLDNAAKDDVLAHALSWKEAGKQVALATVVQTWGSAPRPIGSQLSIDNDGQMVGSVSGGCVEGAVIQEALTLMEEGGHKMLEFGVTNDEAWEVGLACGGKIRIFVEAVN